MNPVGFDPLVADELIGRLRRASVLLGEQLELRRSIAADALVDWRGRFSRDFADEHDRILANLVAIVAACDLARSRVLAAVDQAGTRS